MFFRRLRYKAYQRKFCQQFVNRSKEVKGYEYFLKYHSKHDMFCGSCFNVSVYDVLDNNGFNKLIRSIFKLKKSKNYIVDTHYIKHSFKKVNYINSNIIGTQIGTVADIELKNDKWIKEIHISYTYINTSETVIEYSFSFQKVISTYLQEHQFIVDTIPKIKKKWYFHTYADKEIIKKADCVDLFQLDNIFFADILQGYICTLFYTKYGEKYKLPIEYAVNIHKYNKKKAKKFRKAFLCECYQKGNEHIIVNILNYDRFEVTRLVPGKYLPKTFLLDAFSLFPSELYLRAFGKIEEYELERHMRKYLNSNRVFISSKDIKWLVNKIRYIRETEYKIKNELNEANPFRSRNYLGWTFYLNGKKGNEDFINYPVYTNRFRIMYKQNLDYLNSIATVQNNKIIIILTTIGIFATILGILIGALLR